MRMERLIGIMCVLADAQRTTIGALAERFEVSTRTIARDLDTLGQAGVPLVTFPGAGGGVGVVEGFKAVSYTHLSSSRLSSSSSVPRWMHVLPKRRRSSSTASSRSCLLYTSRCV